MLELPSDQMTANLQLGAPVISGWYDDLDFAFCNGASQPKQSFNAIY